MKTVAGFSHLGTGPRRRRLKPERTPRANEVRFDFEDVTPEERHTLTALCTEYVWRIDNGYAAARHSSSFIRRLWSRGSEK
jgi:hypothetical protein